MRRHRLLLAARIAAWVLVGACVVVFARKLDWHQVSGSFQGVDLRLAALATVIGVPGIALQGLRWASLVKAVRRVPHFTPVAAIFVGQAASALLPMRAGEAVRTGLLARATGLGRATALGTVALDHSVNGLVMFAFAGVLPALLPVPRWVAVTAWVGMGGAVALVLTLFWLAKHHPESHLVPGRGRIASAVARVRSGLMAARNPRAVTQAALFSALAWSVEIVVTLLALAAFNLPHDLPHAMGVLFGVNLAMAIPAPPASLGSFELGAGTALVAFGGDPGHAAAFAIGLHAIQLLPTLVMGGLMVSVFRRPAPELPPAGAQEA